MNNNILIIHVGMDGANFLTACLTMSDEVYFKNFTLSEKIKYFFENISTIVKNNGIPVWNDTIMLYGSVWRSRNIESKVELNIGDKSKGSHKNNKTFIKKIHEPVTWPLKTLMENFQDHPLLKFIESKYYINLINISLFTSLRNSSCSREYTKKFEERRRSFRSCTDIFFGLDEEEVFEVKEEEILTDRLNIEKFNSLTEKLKEKVKQDVHIYNWENEPDLIKYKSDTDVLKSRITHEWDCNWFLNEDETFENISRFYSEMNLGKCNEKLIREMYKIWIRKINYIKQKQIIQHK